MLHTASRFARTQPSVILRNIGLRGLATGPAKGGEISDELLEKLGKLSTQALVDGLWVMGWPSAQINGARPLHPSHRCVGRAVTMRFVPARPDIAQDKPAGADSPEYEAFELCGPKDVRNSTLVACFLFVFDCMRYGHLAPFIFFILSVDYSP